MKKDICKHGIKSSGRCPLRKKSKKPIKSGFKDKDKKDIFLGDKVKVYDRDVRIVKFDRAWNHDDGEKVFGVSSDGQHKPLYRFGSKNIKIIKRAKK